MTRIALIAALALLCAASVSAQPPPDSGQSPTPGQAAAPPLLRVFLDCGRCDADYLRRNVAFVDYVRDRADADVHVLVTTQGTGGGGSSWTLEFIGLGRFQGQDRKLTFSTLPTASQDDERKEFARVFKIGLVGYAAETSVSPELDVTWNQPPGATQTTSSRDSWNYWVFRVDGGGNFNGEERSSNHSYRFSGSANRTTDNWKINLNANGNQNQNRFEVDKEAVVESKSDSWNVNSLVVKSLTPHWSAGGRANVSHSSFSNTDRSIRFAPGIEYDIFPYSESNNQIIVFRYEIGMDFYQYAEPTIYDKTSEKVPLHRFHVGMEFRQPWGSLDVSTNMTQHLNHTDRYRLSINGNTDVRLFKGFSFNMFGGYDKIKDQISLRKGEASPEEVLLRVQQLATGYSYFFGFGLSYRFGSIFNNVVNPRFDN